MYRVLQANLKRKAEDIQEETMDFSKMQHRTTKGRNTFLFFRLRLHIKIGAPQIMMYLHCYSN